MRARTRFRRVAIPATLSLALAACGDSTGPETGALVLSRADLALVPGGEVQLDVRAADGDDSLLDGLEWSSSERSVARVSAEGRVTAVGEGTAGITARAAGGTATAEVRVALLSFNAIATGFAHACGLTPDGEAWCWGHGSALGDSVGAPTTLPVRVAGGLTFREIDASQFYSCALTVEDRAYCWGAGPLGVGISCSAGLCVSTDSSLVPLEVEGGLRFASISLAADKACGVTPDGVAYCWGGPPLGTTETFSSDTPVRVEGDLSFTEVSASRFHACGLTVEGDVYCWGSNNSGALGTGTTDAGSETPVPATALGEDRFTAVMAGEFDTSCAIRADGTLLCWGLNHTGQLGRGFTSDQEPTPEAPVQLGPVVSVAGGAFHVCTVALDGEGRCFGSNGWGQLGDARTTSSHEPVPVLGVAGFTAIDPGTEVTTCGVSTSLIAYCWGRDLGVEEQTSRGVPRRVPGQKP